MKRVLFMAVCAAWLGFSCTSSKIEVDELRVELRENPPVWGPIIRDSCGRSNPKNRM